MWLRFIVSGLLILVGGAIFIRHADGSLLCWIGLLTLFAGMAFLILGMGHMVKNHMNTPNSNNWTKKKIW